MFLKNNLYIIGFIVFFIPIKSHGNTMQFTDSLKNHVILLIDRSYSIRKNGGVEKLEDLLSNEIPSILFEADKVIKEEPLLKRKDYLSIAYFGLGGFNQYTFDNFISDKMTMEDYEKIGKRYWENVTIKEFKDFWNGDDFDIWDVCTGDFTGLSFAGPMGIHFFRQKDNKVHRTFVLIVTDGQFNSIDDPSSELAVASVRDGLGKYRILRNATSVEGIFSDVKANYTWHPELIREQHFPLSLNLYEYKPNQINFSIRSKLDFPSELELERKLNGYETTFDIIDADSLDNYRPHKVLVQISSSNSENEFIFQKEIFFQGSTAKIPIIDLPKENMDNPLKLSLHFWVDFDDDAYGAHQLHPFGSVGQGSEGLTEMLDITIEKQRKILGFIPLSNRMYNFSTNWVEEKQSESVKFWNRFFGLLLFVMSLMIVWWYLVKERELVDPKTITIKTVGGSKII